MSLSNHYSYLWSVSHFEDCSKIHLLYHHVKDICNMDMLYVSQLLQQNVVPAGCAGRCVPCCCYSRMWSLLAVVGVVCLVVATAGCCPCWMCWALCALLLLQQNVVPACCGGRCVPCCYSRLLSLLAVLGVVCLVAATAECGPCLLWWALCALLLQQAVVPAGCAGRCMPYCCYSRMWSLLAVVGVVCLVVATAGCCPCWLCWALCALLLLQQNVMPACCTGSCVPCCCYGRM